MVITMTNKNYCMVDISTQKCDNVIVWDENTDYWIPSDNYIMLVQEDTPAKNWVFNQITQDWELVVSGYGQIGFTWDGVYLITDQPKPEFNTGASFGKSVYGTQTL